jgi:hypothetical protein
MGCGRQQFNYNYPKKELEIRKIQLFHFIRGKVPEARKSLILPNSIWDFEIRYQWIG